MSPHAPQFKRCKVCHVLTGPSQMTSGRCHACAAKLLKKLRPEPEQLELAVPVPRGCAHATAERLVCESCASLVRPLGGAEDVRTGEPGDVTQS